jgi:hypothetical protein
LNGPVFIDFCRGLLHDTPGPVFLVLDGHPVHRSNAVKQFAASTEGRLGLSFRASRRSWTLASGCGRTSSTTASAVPVSAAR